MTQQPARRPSIWTRVLAAAGAVTVIGASIVLSNTPVAAAGLETFSSCDELQAHIDSAALDVRYGGDSATTGPTPSTAPAAGRDQSGDGSGEGSGGTNTQVVGIDELDIVEVLGDGRVLATRDDRILLIDASGRQIVATIRVAGPPQITFDEERGALWAVSSDGASTTLTRSFLDGDTFASTSSWTVDGGLVDLRRNGDRVHLVVVDQDIQRLEGGAAGGVEGDASSGVTPPDASLPFGGTSPVPCDEVLHAPLPGGPATTLVATFAATGELSPVAATEIVGAGDNVLVTDTALYVSTPVYDTDQLVTGIHRFDLRDLTLTGSGSVAGRLLNQFSLDEHAGHLRAAVTVGEGGFVGGPLPVERDAGTGGTVVPATPSVSPSTALNEIVTFDLDGALDVVGRSARFGHPGEILQGIRFAGDIAYAVTFLQTDPLYVVDLSDAAFPRVLGQIEIPGFSAYLHPISATQVIGFGPGGDGRIVGRLFDVSDPASPRLLDTVDIGEDSAIVYDHHALRADGDRLVVAANVWVAERPAGCGPVAGMEQELNDLSVQIEALYRDLEGQTPSDTIPPAIVELQRRIDALSACVYPSTVAQARIVTLTPDGSSLQVQIIETDASDAQRVVPVQGGYLIVGSEVTRVGVDGATTDVLDEGPGGGGLDGGTTPIAGA